MYILKLNSGLEIECPIVVKAYNLPVLHIYTNSIDPGDMFSIFQDKTNTKKMIAINNEDGTERVYRYYTKLHSISPIDNEDGEIYYRIWMDMEIPEDL